MTQDANTEQRFRLGRWGDYRLAIFAKDNDRPIAFVNVSGRAAPVNNAWADFIVTALNAAVDKNAEAAYLDNHRSE